MLLVTTPIIELLYRIGDTQGRNRRRRIPSYRHPSLIPTHMTTISDQSATRMCGGESSVKSTPAVKVDWGSVITTIFGRHDTVIYVL